MSRVCYQLICYFFFQKNEEKKNFSFTENPIIMQKKPKKKVYDFCKLFVIINNDAVLNNNSPYKAKP